MNYYIKISYNSKMKKFIVKDPALINLIQIKNSFSPPISSHRKAIFIVTGPSRPSINLNSQQQLMHYFQNNQFGKGESVRVQVVECSSKKNEESDDQQFYDQFLQNNKIAKARSKSQEIEPNLLTHEFDLNQTHQFLVRSMFQTKSELDNIQSFIAEKEKQIQKLKQQRRETNVKDLLQFLNAKNI